ncbi:MAG TPA: threonine synthase, partial [Candidatus Elarobacter sp.]|nr:threonine synthase [Candidatus Elarobacter sp.]
MSLTQFDRPAEDRAPEDRASRATGALTPRALRCRLCGTPAPAAPTAVCDNCLGPLEAIPPDRATLPSREVIASRPQSVWRYREWLPFDGDPVLSLDTGFTPLVDAPRLAARLGVARCWIKNDSVSHPSLSFKDRVVAMAINAAHAFGLSTVGCASTGNLANAVAAQAARAGLDAWIFIPDSLERGKIAATQVFAPHLVRVRGNYDDVNRLCALVADHFGWGIVNVNLRAYYGEGSKTIAFEIAEQLGWRLPTAVVAPMAGGSLISKLHRGFREFREAEIVQGTPPRLYGAQAAGCAPIVSMVHDGRDDVRPVVPDTVARSIAIGNPADGRFARRAIVESGGWAAAVGERELIDGIMLLAADTGIFTETAGGVTVSAALALAREGRFSPDDEIVLCITGNGLKTLEPILPVLPESPV